MRVVSFSTDWSVFDEHSAVARRQRMQASTLERLEVFVPHGPKQIAHLAPNATIRGFGLGRTLGAPHDCRVPNCMSKCIPMFFHRGSPHTPGRIVFLWSSHVSFCAALMPSASFQNASKKRLSRFISPLQYQYYPCLLMGKQLLAQKQ